VHHVGILYDQFMMHGQRNIKLNTTLLTKILKYLTANKFRCNVYPLNFVFSYVSI